MPSCARKHQLTRSLVYHVFNRSNASLPIFREEPDFQHFMKLLREYSISFKLSVYHWAIMNNHYHLLFEVEEPETISRCMSGLARAYTHYYHRVYKTNGFLWQGRFKLQPVEKESYLFACGRYIERNPVRAGIVIEADRYPYSSARFYCLGLSDGITVEACSYKDFGVEITQRRNKYQEFLRDFNAEEETLFKNIENPAGSREFTKRLIKEHGRYMPRRRGKVRKY